MKPAATAVLLAVLLAIAATSAPPVARGSSRRACARPTAGDLHRLRAEYPRFRRALVRYFGRRWLEAAVVSFGEGSWHSWAANGQYLGTFQMGASERALYGHGPTLEEQVAAAHRYFVRARGWGPWDCRP